MTVAIGVLIVLCHTEYHQFMKPFIAFTTRKLSGNRKGRYFVLRARLKDPNTGKTKERYLGYLGTRAEAKISKLRAIAQRHGLNMTTWNHVRGLRILIDNDHHDKSLVLTVPLLVLSVFS